jgi:hypothetical protein
VAGLCWENPPNGGAHTWFNAFDHCNVLELGGYSDWRLPMVQELISLLRGCVGGVETGDLSTSECGVTDPDCLASECGDETCEYCDQLAGPDDDPEGCYWVPDLVGECDWYWSSSNRASSASYAWVVYFDWGFVSSLDKDGLEYIRCVRGGP